MEAMRYFAGLLEKHKPIILASEWYNQRFDGCPLFIGYIAEAEARKEPRKHGCHFTIKLSFYENQRTDWYIYQNDIDRVTKNFVKLAKQNPNAGSELLSQWQKDELLFFDHCLQIKKTDLGKLDDSQLKNIFQDLNDIYINRLTSSSLIDGFALGSDTLVAEMVLEKLKLHGIESQFTENFSKLTAPVHLSFINDVEVAVLSLAHQISQNPDAFKLFQTKTVEEIKNCLLASETINQKIDRLCDQYFWSKNNYIHDNTLDKTHFIREIKEIFVEHDDIIGHIQKIKQTPLANRKTKEKLIKELEIDGLLLALIKLNEEFTFWQDERKKATYWGTHYFSVLLSEIGKRKGYTVDELKYFGPCEVVHAFEDKDWKPELQARMKGCVFHWDEEHFEVLTGKAFQKFKEEFHGKTDHSHLTELKGLSACLGKVTGKVKLVLSATEVAKVQKGDILVAVMTRPDYIVAMKKAAAIVTNEGGITSHAAIVSRELNIPCIIGTQVATKALKDGDTVQVDADHGIVRILKRAQTD